MNLKTIIKKTKKTLPTFRYDGEVGINPAFFNIENACPLPVGEKWMFALRTDFKLATGLKNIKASGVTTLESKLEKEEKFDTKDRFGHPSLALPEKNGYDGSIYYAGWLAQRKDHIEVYLYTGRFHYIRLSPFEKQCMELYIAIQFVNHYGNYPILFWDWNISDRFIEFLANDPIGIYSERRVYRFYAEKIFKNLR